jgi:hypothetical protein
MKSILVLLLLLATNSFASNDRIALVIGNSKYAEFGVLANPANDARDINKALTEMGYKTRLVLDANESTIRKEFRNFAAQSDSASIAVVFYAGHGAQVNGENFLLPVDMDIPKRDSDIQLSALKVDDVISSIKSKTKVVFLDACRDNPALVKSLSKGRGTYRGGLAATNSATLGDQSSGIFIAYATDAGNVALDGISGDKNSPFTSALLRHIKQPVSIDDMFSMVTKDVRQQTKNSQKPYKYASLDGVICLAGACGISKLENSQVSQQNTQPIETLKANITLPNKWVMFQTQISSNGDKSSIYLNPSTIQRYETRVSASQKWIKEKDGSYEIINYVYDCKSFKSNVVSSESFDASGIKVSNYLWGDFKLVDLKSDYSKPGSIGNSSAKLLCNPDKVKPIADSANLTSDDWVKFYSFTGKDEMFYQKSSFKKGSIGFVVTKLKFPRTIGNEISKKWGIGTGVDDFKYVPYASYFVSKTLIFCKEKKFYSIIDNFYDEDLTLTGYIDYDDPTPNLVQKINEFHADSPMAQLSRLVCN